jgi:hypothetical protein
LFAAKISAALPNSATSESQFDPNQLQIAKDKKQYSASSMKLTMLILSPTIPLSKSVKKITRKIFSNRIFQ